MTPRPMRIAIVILLGVALLACQVAHGGLRVPFLSIPTYALLVVAGILVFLAILSGKGAPLPLALSLGACAAYVAWRCLHSPDWELGRWEMALVMAGGLTWFAVSAGLDRGGGQMWLIGAILATGLVQCGLAICQSANAENSLIPIWFSETLEGFYAGRYTNRARGFFLNPNQLAWQMNVCALLAVGLASWGRVQIAWRIVLLYLAGMFLVTTVLTSSRGGLISLAAGFSVMGGLSLAAILIQLPRRRGWAMFTGAVALLALAVLGWVVFSQSWTTRSSLRLPNGPECEERPHLARDPDVRAGPPVWRGCRAISLRGATFPRCRRAH